MVSEGMNKDFIPLHWSKAMILRIFSSNFNLILE